MTLSFATISKYPPYVSGHSHQAFWLNRELARLLHREQHQVSYCGAVPPWYRDPMVVVHEVEPSPDANPKVTDGHLLKALAARLAGLVHDGGVSALLALYADPHAEVALRAARAARLVGNRVAVAVSVEGSDLTSSMARHTGDGEAMVLLSDIASADVVMAVSERARQLLVATAESVVGPSLADDLAARTTVRHPGLPPESFRRPEAQHVAHWRASHGVEPDQRLISSFVRLVPEKGLRRILDVAHAAQARPDLVFAIAGTGAMEEEIHAELLRRGLTRVRMLGDLSQPQAHLLRAASDCALLPSHRTAEWEETFGIAALEYQALGVPVLASDSPGFAESCALPQFRLTTDASPEAWLERLDSIVQQPRLRDAAAGFAASFTARRSAEHLLDAVEAAMIAQFAAVR